VEVSSQVDRTLVTQREALEEENIHPTTEHRILCPRQAAKKLIAETEDDKIFVL
jgi:hypothetical protein